MCDLTRKSGVAREALPALLHPMTPAYSPAELAQIFAKVERELVLADADSALQVLVHAAVDTVPGAEMAGISLGRGGRFSTPAATDETVLAVDALQYAAGSGPCVDAIIEDTTLNARDLRTDPRWPRFGQAAYARTGVVSMLAFRMFFEDGDQLVAGLNLYSREAAAFDDVAEAVGMLLATHGALAVARTNAREQADNLLTALKTSREIGIAIGVLMQKHKITRDDAFNLLRVASQGTHRKLADIAEQVAETGELPELSRGGQRAEGRSEVSGLA
jgi:ANTAR domain/GAF domain